MRTYRFVNSVRSFYGDVRRVVDLRNAQNVRRERAHRTELPVEHGELARPEELHGHGKLYFVPVGKQAIPVESLADYYRQKFGIEVTVLPAVETKPSDYVAERRQYVAEELISDMTSAYGEIARNPGSVMIALTDDDIFPQREGWNFTFSYHSARIGIVSSRRTDPGFWGEQPDEAAKLAGTKQMLTKYVAMQYFHLPDSFDPTSIMYTPLSPNGGPDDIYESDLHPEESVNGQRGVPFPCLYFSYSYKTHKIEADEPVLGKCELHNAVVSTDEEKFETNLGWGELTQRSMDITLDSTPAIEFRRGYSSGYAAQNPFAMGWNTNHSYNSYFYSNGLANLRLMSLSREDGVAEEFERIGGGLGFDPKAIYETQELDNYGAHVTWDSDHYKLQYRDGAWSTFFPCVNKGEYCYWTGYQDAQGNTLQFDRGPHRELHRLTASDQQGISFELDDHDRTTKAKATDGQLVTYEYDAEGCLAKVQRSDGQVTLYTYDANHRMTSFAVIRAPGAAPETLLTNEYDNQGRLVQQTLAGVGVYKVEYLSNFIRPATKWKVTNPEGRTWTIADVNDTEYVARTAPVKFPAAQTKPAASQGNGTE